MTDEIKIGQEYVEGSVAIDKNTPGGRFSYVKANFDDKVKTGTLTYRFNGDINETYVITFKTKVTDPNVYAGNRKENYFNVSKLTGENIKDSTSQGTQNVQSKVISKTSQDYNYVTREITWKVLVNKNKMILHNAYITDIIKEGQEFVTDSVMLNGIPAEASNYVYDAATRTLRYNFPSEIKDEQVVTFKTKITDTSIFNTNGENEISNTAKLINDLVPGGVESAGTVNVKSSLIDKKANYTKGNSYIDWNVTINSNKLLLIDAVLTDRLQEGLELDTASVKLNKQILNSDGTLSKGEEVSLDKNNVKYDAATREFTFILPSPSEEAYILTFRTDVVDKKKSPFTNSISFKGTGITESSDSGKVDVIFQGAGGGGVGETGSIKVIKVDKNNEDKKLEGAVFELLDKYQNVIRTSEPTSSNGEVVFNKLKFDIDYYVREKAAPAGYVLSDELYRFQLKNTQDEKNIIYNYKNQIITGQIELFKTDDNNNPLKGAEFKLYKEADTSYENPVTTAISDENGKVEFKNVEYGKYIIKETKAPEGYLVSEGTIKVFVDKDRELYTYNVVNNRIKGVIIITKTDMNGKLLQGAEFTLYDKNGKEVTTVASDKDGIAIFNDVDYGDYTIKETKAPKGYVLSKEQLEVKVTSPETQKFTVKNEAEKLKDKIVNVIPKTGSLFDLKVVIIIGILTILSGIGLLLKTNRSR